MDNIIEALRLKTQLDELRPIKKEDEIRIMQKFRLDWNYHSNNIEGNLLTFGETKALILHGITAQGKPLKDHFEITGHDEAVRWIIEVVKQKRPLTENFIRELHKLILKEPYEVNAITPEGKPTKKKINIGEYKSTSNHVKTSTGELFRFASPEETPAQMHDLMGWYKNELTREDVNPIILAANFHYKFIRIHPFDDGNGRTARILMNFILMQFDYPPVIIKTENKQDYYAVLRQADGGVLEPFIDYIAKNLVHSLDLMVRGAKGEDIEELEDFDKELKILEQKLKEQGKNIEKTKSKEVLSELFDKSLSVLFRKFIQYCEKFDRFYSNIFYKVHNGSNTSTSNGYVFYMLNSFLNLIKDGADSIDIEYCYSNEKYDVEQFDYSSKIEFEFNQKYYKVRMGDIEYQKKYDEPLSEKEIEEIVKREAEKHKEYIEERLKK